jgi:hypothetical protein
VCVCVKGRVNMSSRGSKQVYRQCPDCVNRLHNTEDCPPQVGGQRMPFRGESFYCIVELLALILFANVGGVACEMKYDWLVSERQMDQLPLAIILLYLLYGSLLCCMVVCCVVW